MGSKLLVVLNKKESEIIRTSFEIRKSIAKLKKLLNAKDVRLVSNPGMLNVEYCLLKSKCPVQTLALRKYTQIS